MGIAALNTNRNFIGIELDEGYFKIAKERIKCVNKEMLKKWDEDSLDFFPTCPRSIYDMQVEAMTYYKNVLEAHAKMKQIHLILPVEY